MKNYKLLSLWIFIFVVITGAPLICAQEKMGEMDIDTNAYEPSPQGTIIPCELCVVLYPERYEKKPQTCPVCHGAKEHFQSAQMMSREMSKIRLHEIDLEIQEFLYKTVLDSLAKPVKLDELKRLRKFYMSKLIHLMVYDFLEVEPVKDKIRQLDKTIEFREEN